MQQISMRLTLAALISALALDGAVGTSLLRKNGVVPKKDVKIKNPMKHSAGDVVAEEGPAKPKYQEYDHIYSPVSPPAQRDVSPTDPIEYIHGWEGYAAQALDHMSADQGMKFEGSTCNSVCAACSIYAAQLDSGGCFCYATCKMGECGAAGAMPHVGWSNNEVSTPKTMWHASCNVGEKNCESQCMEDKLKKELTKCEDDMDPLKCFKKLSQMNEPLPMDARKQVHYCTREGMTTCDTFMNVPAEGGWACFELKQKCKQKTVKGFSKPMPSHEAPSVWHSIQ